MKSVIIAMLWFSALSCGVLAGLYFAFSAFVMRALGRIEPKAGIAAMNAINADIQRSLFMPIFLGSTFVAAILVPVALRRLELPYGLPVLAGSLIYLSGMFLVTMLRNVPLNNALMMVDGSSAEDPATWSRYLTQWTQWNHMRTFASLAGCGLYVRAIALL